MNHHTLGIGELRVTRGQRDHGQLSGLRGGVLFPRNRGDRADIARGRDVASTNGGIIACRRLFSYRRRCAVCQGGFTVGTFFVDRKNAIHLPGFTSFDDD